MRGFLWIAMGLNILIGDPAKLRCDRGAAVLSLHADESPIAFGR